MEVDQIQESNHRFTKLLKLTGLVMAWAYVIIYLWIVSQRIQYPFELEWIEGGMVDQVQRIVNGQGIYTAPSINFVPYLYPPLYFYLSALASFVFGGGLFPLRFISFAASLASIAAIALIVQNETKDWWVAILSAGLFTAAYRVTGAWLDIARVDSLFLALWLFFIYFVRAKKTLIYALLTGILFSLAFLTKQTALIACLPILAYVFWINWKYAFASLSIAALIIGMSTLILNQTSSGWYYYYVFTLLSQQTEWLPIRFITFWNKDLLANLPLAMLFTIFLFFKKPYRTGFEPILWVTILTGALVGTFLTRVKGGGYDNVLLPVYAAIAILFGLGLNEFIKTSEQLPAEYRILAGRLTYIACIMQFLLLLYNPFSQIPTESDLLAGNKLIKLISSVHGYIYLPDHGYLPTLAGKQSYAHHSAIWDVMRGNKQTPGKALLQEEINRAVRQQVFDVIIMDSDWNYCCAEIDKYYFRQGEVFQDKMVFYPVTGWEIRPTYIYIAKRLRNSEVLTN